MKVGDLVRTNTGNIAMITKIGDNYVNLLYPSGTVRDAYPLFWITPLEVEDESR